MLQNSTGVREVKVAQSFPTLCNPMDYSLPGASVHEILQARMLQWAAVSFSRGSSQPRDQTQVSHITGRFFTVWATREAQEYWNGLPFPSSGDLPDPGLNLGILHFRQILDHLSQRDWEKLVDKTCTDNCFNWVMDTGGCYSILFTFIDTWHFP